MNKHQTKTWQALKETTVPEINSVGDKSWCNEYQQLHREYGPALILKNGKEFYCINGKIYREDGPAVICANGEKSYWLDDKSMSREMFFMIKLSKWIKKLLRL